MKVYLGPYTTWIGPYQIAEILCFWARPVKDENGFEDRPAWVHEFGHWLAENRDGSESWLSKLCQWIQNKKKRVEYVHIDNYDVWGMDHTLALIIYPMLKKLKVQKHGYGLIDDSDVPKEIRSTARGARKGLNKWDWDHNAEKRYEYMLDELIWTFAQLADDNDNEGQFFDHSESEGIKDLNESISKLKVDREGLKAHQARIDNGLRLFGKYFRTLWD